MSRIREANAKPSPHPRSGIMACAEPNAAPMRNAPARSADGRAAAPWLSDAAKASIDSASASRIMVVMTDRYCLGIKLTCSPPKSTRDTRGWARPSNDMGSTDRGLCGTATRPCQVSADQSPCLRLPPVRVIEMPSVGFDRLNDPHRSAQAIGPAPDRLGACNDLHQYDVQLGVGHLGQPAVADDIVDPLLDLCGKRAILRRREPAHVDLRESGRHGRADVAHTLAQRLVGGPSLALVEPQL